MTPMFILPPVSAALAVMTAALFASSPSSPAGDGPLAPAIEARDRADELFLQGKHAEAVMDYEDAIWLGRRAIVNSEEETESDEDGAPVRFLVSLYRSSALNRLSMSDLDGARTEAWAACVHAQSLATTIPGDAATAAAEAEVGAQAVMAAVCRAGDDAFGESQAWRRVLELTKTAEGDGERDPLPGTGDIEENEELPRSREAVEKRLGELDDKLKRKFGGGQ
eukprot:CAMPEP_0183305204 /NCGR_PEP_ID=MMETSP0160_2-20130417/10027_1 /TAXON_ID=2839 ORGANISM="Odontella Sinensis, Strain Grunow 1884" /NCGR_SAMPLE_ID=MMETSP0160_2 /ASSEMBLY_ACC=CAM_ASM_000250 /LENGTH=222 /DNA_ID=CAMNT_0025468373 /DNA_START=71 /DNA_END=739 /DNA_ORIENTATION=-